MIKSDNTVEYLRNETKSIHNTWMIKLQRFPDSMVYSLSEVVKCWRHLEVYCEEIYNNFVSTYES